MDKFWLYAGALLPSIGVGYLFYIIIKNLLEGDRNERIAMARLDKAREERDRQHSPESAKTTDPA
jgi:hypothetical protein